MHCGEPDVAGLVAPRATAAAIVAGRCIYPRGHSARAKVRSIPGRNPGYPGRLFGLAATHVLLRPFLSAPVHLQSRNSRLAVEEAMIYADVQRVLLHSAGSRHSALRTGKLLPCHGQSGISKFQNSGSLDVSHLARCGQAVIVRRECAQPSSIKASQEEASSLTPSGCIAGVTASHSSTNQQYGETPSWGLAPVSRVLGRSSVRSPEGADRLPTARQAACERRIVVGVPSYRLVCTTMRSQTPASHATREPCVHGKSEKVNLPSSVSGADAG